MVVMEGGFRRDSKRLKRAQETESGASARGPFFMLDSAEVAERPAVSSVRMPAFPPISFPHRHRRAHTGERHQGGRSSTASIIWCRPSTRRS